MTSTSRASRGTRRRTAALRKAARRARGKYTECTTCGKRSYPTSDAASDAIIGSAGKAGRRVYQCGTGWHITSSPRWNN